MSPSARLSSTFLRYLVFQIPGTVVVVAVSLWLWRQGWVVGTTACFAVTLWVAKDMALYPFVRGAYEPAADGLPRAGSDAVVVSSLDPEGWVKVRGERWRAVSSDGDEIEEGSAVVITGAEAMKLQVERKTTGC